MDKTALRNQLRLQRKHLKRTHQRQAAILIAQQMKELPFFKSCQHLAGYYPHHHEVDPLGIFEHAWEMKKKTYLPILQKETQPLVFVQYRLGDALIPNHHHIPEPYPIKFIETEELDIVLVPLVGFDQQGNRLGSGKGYYDRTFTFLKKTSATPVLIGLAYSCQEVDHVPIETWDIPLHYVITEKQIFHCLS